MAGTCDPTSQPWQILRRGVAVQSTGGAIVRAARARGRSPQWPRSCLPPSAARPKSWRLSDEEAIVSTPSMNTAGRHALAPPHVQPRIESAPARGAAPVHVVARAGENRTRDYGLIVLAPLRGGSGVDTSPPAGCCRETVVSIRQLVSSQWFTGGRFSWSIQSFPGATRLFPEGCSRRRASLTRREEERASGCWPAQGSALP